MSLSSKSPMNSAPHLSETIPISMPEKVINAQHRFQKTEHQDDIFSQPAESHFVYEATDFQKKINIPPITIEKGHRVKVTVKNEQIGTVSSKENFSENDTLHNLLSYRIIELEKALHEEKENKELLLQKLNSLEEKQVEKKNHVASQREEVVMIKENNIYKQIMIILNVSSIFFYFGSFIFLIMALFNLVLPRLNSIFAFLLLFICGTMFYLDKLYRRSLN